jgi:hypothetical protein
VLQGVEPGGDDVIEEEGAYRERAAEGDVQLRVGPPGEHADSLEGIELHAAGYEVVDVQQRRQAALAERPMALEDQPPEVVVADQTRPERRQAKPGAQGSGEPGATRPREGANKAPQHHDRKTARVDGFSGSCRSGSGHSERYPDFVSSFIWSRRASALCTVSA